MCSQVGCKRQTVFMCLCFNWYCVKHHVNNDCFWNHVLRIVAGGE